MKLSKDESRALAFVAFLLVLSAIARYATAPETVHASGSGLDLAALEQASQARMDSQGTGRPGGGRSRGRGRSQARGQRAGSSEPADTSIDPNEATVEQLAALPKVSLPIAQSIVAARDTGLWFETAADLANVKGVTRRMIDQIAGRITLPRGDTMPVPQAVSAYPRVRRSAAAKDSGAARRKPAAPVDVNHATAQDLEAVPGIGPGLAQKIIKYRDKKGPFRSLDDLLAVGGIGPATLGRSRDWLVARP